MSEEPRGGEPSGMPEVPAGRVRTDWPGLVAAWKVSGQSQTQFCRERGVSRWQFGQWKVRLEGRDSPGGVRLVGLKGIRAAAGDQGPEGMVLSVGERYRVEIPARFDAEALVSLLEVLEGR